MADITMCMNSDCHMKDVCYRWCAKIHPTHQSWSMFEPDADGDCQHFIDYDTEGDDE